MSYLHFDKTLMINLEESLPREILRTNSLLCKMLPQPVGQQASSQPKTILKTVFMINMFFSCYIRTAKIKEINLKTTVPR